jgi:hypothetical protein
MAAGFGSLGKAPVVINVHGEANTRKVTREPEKAQGMTVNQQ